VEARRGALHFPRERLGYQSITMTMRYAHLSPDRLRDAVAALDDFSTTSPQSPVESLPSLVNTRQD